MAEILAVSKGWPVVHQLSKPAIMLGLIGYYLSSAGRRNNSFVRAMFFCLAGDILLLGQSNDEIYFILGLLAFLVGHVLYILAYRQLQWSTPNGGLTKGQKMLSAFPVAAAGVALLVVLFPKLDHLTVPVTIYAFVLMLMVITAIFRSGRTSAGSFLLILLGAVFFMTSDSMLAINKFYTPFDYAGPLIMLTYSLAQYMIVEGVLQHDDEA